MNLKIHYKAKQRTKGPVNAHLISRPSISTKANLNKFDITVKLERPIMTGGIIYTNFADLESPLPHSKFQDHRTSGSEEDF